MTTAAAHPSSIALTNPDDDNNGGGYPEIHPEPAPETKPERPIPTPLTDLVKSSIYKELSQNECIVLSLLDSFYPGNEAVSWFCPWMQLAKLAAVAPSIADDQIMPIVGTLCHLKIIDICVGEVNGEPGVFVSAYKHRARLRHDFMQHVVRNKRAVADRVADASEASAAA